MAQQGEPPAQEPLTREDVLRLIEGNGGTARGLDLSRRNLALRLAGERWH